MRLAPQKKVFLRGGVSIPVHSQLGRLQVGKPRLNPVTDKKGAPKRSPVSHTVRSFLAGPLPAHSNSGAVKGLVEVYTWGEGGNGQLGHGDNSSRKLPAKVEALRGKGIIYNNKQSNSISCGVLHSGVVNSFGETFTWGSNFFLQTGHDNSSGGTFMNLDGTEPTPGSLKSALPRGFSSKAIACGGWHNLLLGDVDTSNGVQRAVYVWGNGGQGQLGIVGNKPFTPPPTKKSKKKAEEMKESKQSENPPLPYLRYPQALEALSKPSGDPKHIVQVAAGAAHSVALTQDGDVYWWGEKRFITVPEKLDLLIEDPLRFKSIACGAFHTVGLTKEGKLYSWGSGQINPALPLSSKLDPHFVSSVDSVAPPPRYRFSKIELNNVASIAAANDVSLALTKDGKLYFWEGTTNKPVHILKNKKIVDFAISWTHIGAVTETGALYMWQVDETMAQSSNEEPEKLRVDASVPLPKYAVHKNTPAKAPAGAVLAPTQLTHDPAPYPIPTRIKGVLTRKSVIGIRLGFNFAVATAIPKRLGPPPKRLNLRELLEKVDKFSSRPAKKAESKEKKVEKKKKEIKKEES